MDHAAAQLLGVRPDHLRVVAGAVIKSARSKSFKLYQQYLLKRYSHIAVNTMAVKARLGHLPVPI